MARRLGDVLHHFDPHLGAREATAAPAATPRPRPAPRSEVARLVTVPVGPGDLLRVAAVWNLAVEVARHGAPALALLSARDAHGLDAGPGPIGSSIEVLAGDAPEILARDARARASRWGADDGEGLAFACLPADGLERSIGSEIEWVLLLTAPSRTALRDSERLARRLLEASPMARVGVAIHGVHTVAEAREAFEQLAEAVERAVGRGLASYGLLVDDLALYRALVERRPVGLARPQSPASRALSDVARLLLEDAGSPASPA